jgi:PAS domain S-box-containing protein
MSRQIGADRPAQSRGVSAAITPGLFAGFAAIVVVLVTARIIGTVNLRNVYTSSEAVSHTHTVKDALQQVLTTALDAETGGRGFLILGIDSYLEPYNRARLAMAGNIARARALTTDDREQHADVDRLSVEVDLKMSELAEAIRQRRESGFAAAQAAVATNVGKRTMDEMRSIVARMDAREDVLLSARTAQASQSYRSGLVTGFATTSLALLAVAALFFVARRSGVERLRNAEMAERLRVTLASIGDGVIATDDQGRVVSLNAVAESLTGWSAGEAEGRRLEEIFVIVHEETRRPADNPIGRVLRERVIVGLANHTVLIAKNGREIPIDDSAAPIKTADGRFVGAIMVFRDVSDRRTAERERAATVDAERLARAEAEEAEKRLRIALEAGRMGTWEYSMRSGAVTWSASLEAIHGLSPGTFPGTFDAFATEIHPADRDRVRTAIRDAVEQRRDHEIEYRIVRSDGAVRWVEGRGQLFLGEDGQPDRLIGVCSDITARKHAEQTLAHQAQLLQTIDDAIYEMDPDLRITSWNSAAERVYGYSAAEAIGAHSGDLLQSKLSPEQRAAFVTRVAQGEILRLEPELRRKDGAVVWVDMTAIAKRSTDGMLAGFVAVGRDITQRKQADERFRLAVDAAPAAMILVDRLGTIVMVNTITERVLGYTRDEIVGQSIERLLPARFQEHHAGYRAAFAADPHSRPMGMGRDLYALHKDGSEVPVEIGLSPIDTAEGRFVLAAVTDITSRKQVEEERQQLLQREQAAHAEADAANRAKDQFLAMISHELRTPLNAIVGWSDMLRRGTLPESRRARAVEAIYDSAKRQGQLIEELLDVGRIMSGKLRLERTAVDLQDIVRGAVDVVQVSRQAKRIDVTVDIDASLGPLYADATRLQQVVWNLVSNAIKFTPEGGAVHVRAHHRNSEVELVVTDTGQGIPAPFLAAIFEAFQQADGSSTRRHGGLGLGLAIAKHLVEAHGGTISAESPGDGQGATFTVRLPIVAVYANQIGSASESPSTTVTPATLSRTALHGVSVLVVDDDDNSRELVSVTLEAYGADVLLAATAKDGYQIAATRQVDVLLADIAMPNENGYDLIRSIRARESNGERPLAAAALTSFARDEDREQARQAGFNIHLAKPIDAHMLVEAVAGLANRMQSL